MERQQLGKTELHLSRVGFGCSRIGGFSEAGSRRKSAKRLLGAALDAGINFFDTADAYANGDSEALLGEALGNRRSEVVLCTKGGYVFRERVGNGRPWEAAKHIVRKAVERSTRAPKQFDRQDFSPRYLEQAVNSSLRRLKTDYIDLYQLHAPRTQQAWSDEVIHTLRGLKAAGKIRYFGVGLESLEDTERWLAYDDLSCLQLPFGILDQQALTDALPRAAARGVGVLVRGVFGGGWVNTRLTDGEIHAGSEKWRRILAYRQLARDRDLNLHSLALNFALHPPGVGAAVLGMRSQAHLARTLKLLPPAPLPDDVLRYVRCVDQYAPLGP